MILASLGFSVVAFDASKTGISFARTQANDDNIDRYGYEISFTLSGKKAHEIKNRDHALKVCTALL